jgi:hypothetical protein
MRLLTSGVGCLLLSLTLTCKGQTTMSFRTSTIVGRAMETRSCCNAEGYDSTAKNLYHTVTAQQLNESFQQLSSDLPKLNHHQIVVRIMKITAIVRDGHSGVRGGRSLKIYESTDLSAAEGRWLVPASIASRFWAAIENCVIQFHNFESDRAVRTVNTFLGENCQEFLAHAAIASATRQRPSGG